MITPVQTPRPTPAAAATPAATPPPPAPSAPPRPLTPTARRRSIGEPSVRFWWSAALILFAVTIYFLIASIADWSENLSIVRHGTPVTATIIAIGDGEVQARSNVTPDYTTTLSFQLDGTDYTVKGHLEGRQDTIGLKLQVPIKVDPANPTNWTYLTEAPPFAPVFIGPGLILPFALAALALSLFLRARTLNIWKTGQPHLYIVHATQQTSLAPRSRAIRCRAADGRTKQLVQVFIPRTIAPKVGELIWLIHPPGKPTAAVAAMNYEGTA